MFYASYRSGVGPRRRPSARRVEEKYVDVASDIAGQPGRGPRDSLFAKRNTDSLVQRRGQPGAFCAERRAAGKHRVVPCTVDQADRIRAAPWQRHPRAGDRPLDIGHYQSKEGETRTSFDVWADEIQAMSSARRMGPEPDGLEAEADAAEPALAGVSSLGATQASRSGGRPARNGAGQAEPKAEDLE